MSGNINDTHIDLIKTQVHELIHDITNTKDPYAQENLKDKYNYLFTTSKTLYSYIFTLVTHNHDQEKFFKKLNIFLENISNIQQSKISQYDASSIIGETLAEEYVLPQLQ